LTKEELDIYFSLFDIRRLESYAHNRLDYHVITDLMPTLAKLYFLGKFPITLPALQATILVGFGLQHKSLDMLSVFISNFFVNDFKYGI
jgi:N-acetyltransferase 10